MEDTWKPPVFPELQSLGCTPPQGLQGGLLNISGLMGIPFPDLPQNGPWTNYFVTLEMVPSGPPTTSLKSCGTLPPKTKPNEQKHRITP